MVKIIFGPTMGYAAGFHPLVTTLLTITGMMTTVSIFSVFGERLRHTAFIRFFKFKKVFSKKSRKFVTLWKKYGIIGISFLTPILLSPPGGAILALAFGGSRKQMFVYMFVFSVLWSFLLTYGFYYSSDGVRELMGFHK
ncbi:MAG: hypothetical protein L3J29_02015 [Cyclobacteriaceae bacterium]|nr:hypothetical protein [Cyclobacteriaceae bacterium]